MKLSVIGLGKLGLPMAACLATKFNVVGVDVNPERIESLKRLQPRTVEPGLYLLLMETKGHLTFTMDTEAAVADTHVTFVVVPTPSKPSGAFSLEYVLQVCETIGQAVREKIGHVVVITSTVMPGSTGGEIRECLETASGKKAGRDFGLCYNPEFIALGSVIRDFRNPDLVLIGESDRFSGDLIEGVYKTVCQNDPPVARMNFVNAELAKLSLNTYVTTKITFANCLARICETLPGADADAVTRAIGLDSRIGPRYLVGGLPFGGPCFPRDCEAFASMDMMEGIYAWGEMVTVLNKIHAEAVAEIINRHAQGATVGFLGIAYKPQTDVLDCSPTLAIAKGLSRPAVAWDPLVKDCPDIPCAKSLVECLEQSSVVVVATACEGWRQLESLGPLLENKTVIDCWRLLEPERLPVSVKYVALGVGPKEG